ncbi:helix-turn-helix domain-containing protein [Lacrimispora indolis]|uniref:helix-turn-helix domain-containing protein n=1 Tax=Lacrimispora indolis TaxID=69825 RepID=UPI0004044BB7|nr:helix-turn-helix transcriptional regulator [[Clostridium] methoxybenzovorans]
MLYEDNEQVKELIKSLMAEKNISYRSLANKLDTSQQNIYKILNKKQLKLDDVLMVCKALDMSFYINFVSPNDEIDVYEELELLKTAYKEAKKLIEKYERVMKKYDEMLAKVNDLVVDIFGDENDILKG